MTANKDRLRQLTTIPLGDECSLILTKGIPPKLGDTKHFIIPCFLQEVQVHNALADLGESVNLMPLSLFEKLGLGKLRPTLMTIQLADKSVKLPKGIAEDIMVQVDKLIFPVDFVVMEIDEDKDIPHIPGRPFLNTARVIIDVNDGSLKLRVGLDEVTFNIHKIMKHPNDDDLGLVESIHEILDEHLGEILMIHNLRSTPLNKEHFQSTPVP
ncbi:uncharacterized protein [Rutidosis leptorrhynchoides]|uniref:uncharacterized protein n=1 Tax=Rutidosis leptorrhynchoides TaxID=125765 RepID=UPI003A9948CB